MHFVISVISMPIGKLLYLCVMRIYYVNYFNTIVIVCNNVIHQQIETFRI